MSVTDFSVDLQRPELAVAASCLLLYVAHVAYEVARRVRGNDRIVVIGWLLGGALALGSGLWSVDVLLHLAAHGSATQHDVALSLASLLLGTAAAFAGLWTVRRSERQPALAVFGFVGLVAALVMLHVLGSLAIQFAGMTPGTSRFPGDSLALLSSLAALVLLTMALLMARLELRLAGKTEQLAESLRQANEDLQKIAFHDPLTGLPNRLVFEDRLAHAVAKADREGRRLALLFIDLDGFKPINDSYGHSAGDQVLRDVGARLRALARQVDTMARVGGDEFLMLLEGRPDEGSAAIVAQRVLRELSAPYDLGEREVSVSCSIGIVFYPEGGAQSKLIAHADAAMYAAKRAGGSTYCFFESSMDADAREQVELLRDLREAMQLRQLELYYQPKIDARSGQVTAAEALIRWNHPRRGLIPPHLFIPIAERFGLIGAIGNWALDEVCRQAREWRDQGLRMRVAVNLSVHQMRQDDLVQRVQSALRRHRIDPRQLTCEITESVAMEDARATQTTFRLLGQAGVHLSIDDFGTGYSSLAYLRQLPAEELKIDRSFVLDVATSADARAIVDAVVRLAHALGLRVVAEGVENERQRELLLQLGCDELQGYLFARPMSARALLLWAIDDRAKSEEFRASLFDDGNSMAAPLH